MIVDASMYFNEKELIELRVKYLDDLIDCFVIIEADVTHQGKKKKWNFPSSLSPDLESWFVSIIVDLPYPPPHQKYPCISLCNYVSYLPMQINVVRLEVLIIC